MLSRLSEVSVLFFAEASARTEERSVMLPRHIILPLVSKSVYVSEKTEASSSPDGGVPYTSSCVLHSLYARCR